MRRHNKIFFVYAILLVTGTANAQKQKPPAGGTPKDFKLSAKKVKQFPNGLQTTFVQYGELPKVSVSLIIKTGNVHESANQVWLADLTGRMLKEGTQNMNFAALSRKVAGMGGDINVTVGMDQTTISGSVLSEYAGDFIKAMSEIAMNPAFPASEIDRLKGDLKRQLTVQKAVPQAQAEEKFFQAIYKDHPYGRYFPTEAMIESYDVKAVKDFYNKNFGAKRSVLYVVGKFDEAAVTAAVNASLSKWKAGPDIYYPPAQQATGKETAIIDRKSSPQTTLILGLPMVTPKDKDYVATTVTNSLLGGSFGSRITSNIRENKGYTYSPFSTIQNRKGVSVWYEEADVTSEHTIASLNEIEKEIKRLQNEPPSKEELEGIQNYQAGIFVLRNSSTGGIIGQLNFMNLHGLPDSYLTNLVKNMYAVTPQKVSEIMRQHFKFENMKVVMVGDKEQIAKQQTELGGEKKKAF
jgi:zinc protease